VVLEPIWRREPEPMAGSRWRRLLELAEQCLCRRSSGTGASVEVGARAGGRWVFGMAWRPVGGGGQWRRPSSSGNRCRRLAVYRRAPELVAGGGGRRCAGMVGDGGMVGSVRVRTWSNLSGHGCGWAHT
jgi:hypothetical protein